MGIASYAVSNTTPCARTRLTRVADHQCDRFLRRRRQIKTGYVRVGLVFQETAGAMMRPEWLPVRFANVEVTNPGCGQSEYGHDYSEQGSRRDLP